MSRQIRTRLIAALAVVGSLVAFSTIAMAGDVTGTVTHRRGTENLVVYVTQVAGHFSPTPHAVMDQRRMRFSPFVLPVVVGTTVTFQNNDSVVHNVFSPDNEAYNLGTWPAGESRSHRFTRAGVYTQACSLHPEMEAYILVLQNPYFAVTAADGSFTIPNLPDGHYQVQVWGKRLTSSDKRRHFPLTVTNGTATANITF
ncbi:MAG: hypothetical protein GXP55_19735 [Deltaproteobacteria bacterium]|nr:hypothetical protein [Deltaproteobacteria bacterium]